MDTTAHLKVLASFIPMNSLSPASLANLARSVKFKRVGAGVLLFGVGEDRSTAFFLVDGELRLEDPAGRVQHILRAGTNEASHRIGHPAMGKFAARCIRDCRALYLDSGLLDVIVTWDQSEGLEVGELGADAQTAGDDWMIRLLRIPAFQRIQPMNLQAMFLRMREARYGADEIIVRQHEPGDYFYVILEGRCRVLREAPNGKSLLLAELESGSCFGEEALISDEPRNATVEMIGAGRLMRLARDDFTSLLKEPLLSRLTFDEAERRVRAGSAKWLDVRFADEYQSGHLPGSISLPLQLLRLQLRQLDSTSSYIVVCDSGRRSSIAVAVLGQKGYDAYLLDQGLPTSYGSVDRC